MNKCETMAALQAWNMAINHALTHTINPDDIQQLAQHYGLHTSTPENIETASHLFNWVNLFQLIEDNNE